MVIANVLGGGFTPACRSFATAAVVMVCQPAALSPSRWAERVAGGTTGLGSELPASAKGTIRWYSRIGTCKVEELALTIAVFTEMAPGTVAGSQLLTSG